MAPMSTLLRRALPRRRLPLAAASSSIHEPTGRSITGASASAPSGHRINHRAFDAKHHFSALAHDDDTTPSNPNRPPPLLPTKHSRSLPPPVCPPALLRSEVEALFDAPVGSLIVYPQADLRDGQLKSAEEEVREAYYASDAAVQRAEYVMRGLNALVSDQSLVARSLTRGAMEYEEEDGGGGSGDGMAREEGFRAMLDLLRRMEGEGEAYAALRTRVRSQLIDPSAGEAAEDSDSSSSSDSSDSSDGSSDEEGELGGADQDEETFDKWSEAMEENMSKAGFPQNKTSTAEAEADDSEEEEASPEQYQFGADPGTTTHMYDLILDALACLCQEQYGTDRTKGAPTVDLVDVMPDDGGSPPELAKEFLDTVLHRHWIDGGDIGLGTGRRGGLHGVGNGVGVGAGTGAGALATTSPFDLNYDVRTCPTPLTFNAVIRIAANFDPVAHAEAVEHAKILSGDMGNAASGTGGGSGDPLQRERERLRDVTLDAALSTYNRMQSCAALTLRSLKASTKRATSREALKRQAKLLDENYNKRKAGLITGRNGATYAYLLQTLTRCVPPSMSRGNMAFALYNTGCAEEGVLDERLVRAMGGVGGYEYDEDGNIATGGDGAPPVANGPIFDAYLQKELGGGIEPAMTKGRRVRHDKNYKLRRHVEWDDTY